MSSTSHVNDKISENRNEKICSWKELEKNEFEYVYAIDKNKKNKTFSSFLKVKLY